MIIVVSSSSGEAGFLAQLCEQRSWPNQACTSLSDFEKLVEKNEPRAVVVRQRLQDGYSDDLLAVVRKKDVAKATRVIVLASADCSIRQEARQVSLGADCVLRDPVRIEVLLEYLGKYNAMSPNASAAITGSRPSYEFAGVTIFPHEQRMARLHRSIHVAPQEIELIRLLSRSAGKVVPYPVLYSELFCQRFAGDTANSRVLLGKVSTSFKRLGVNLRSFVEVIPKSGYLYAHPASK